MRHKLPQTISFIDVDGFVRELDISHYFKAWGKCIHKAARDADSIFMPNVYGFQTNTWMCS